MGEKEHCKSKEMAIEKIKEVQETNKWINICIYRWKHNNNEQAQHRQ